MFPVQRLVEDRIEPEIHRTHIERGHLRTGVKGCCASLLKRHAMPATGRNVNDRISLLLDARQKLHEDPRDRVSGDRHSGHVHGGEVLMHPPPQQQRVTCDLVRSNRQMRRHCRSMD